SQVGSQSQNIGRNAVLAAGFPESVPATTVDRQCGSSQQALHFAAQGVAAGAYDVAIAAGVESMSVVPMGAAHGARKFGKVYPPSMRSRYRERRYAGMSGFLPQGNAADLIADQWGLTRDGLDAFGAQSQTRAAAARDAGRFEAELITVAERRVDAESGSSVETGVKA